MKNFRNRWTRQRATSTVPEHLLIDYLIPEVVASNTDVKFPRASIEIWPDRGLVRVHLGHVGFLEADEARIIGTRLIEAATLADNGRSVREP